jgi:hypothetical protein
MFWLAFVLWLLIAFMFFLANLRGTDSAAAGIAALVAPTVAFGIIWFAVDRPRCRAIEACISAGQVKITVPGIVVDRRFVWSHQDIRAIDAWEGLCLGLKGGESVRVLTMRAWNELALLAQALRDVLRVPKVLPPDKGEVAVTFRGPFWVNEVDAVLSAEPGRLALRHPLIPTAYLWFGADTGNLNWALHGWIPLEPSDVRCTVTPDGLASLDVSPNGFTCRNDAHGPTLVRLGLRRYLSGGGVQVGEFRQRGVPFEMTIWCDDAAKLTTALARFWGSKEEQSRNELS